MEFELNASQLELVATVRAFGEHYFSDTNVKQWQHDQGLPDEVVRDFVNLDFKEFAVVHRRNHVNYDLFEQTLVIEELARVSGATLSFQNDLLNLQIMEKFAGSGQFEFVRSQYQKTGRLAFALAISEPTGGSDLLHMQTTTRSVGGRLLINGAKCFVNNGEYAPYLLVAAIDGDRVSTKKYPPVSFWFVPRDLPGITILPVPKIGQSMLPFADVSFDNVELDASYRLQDNEAGFPQLFHLFEIGRLLTCSVALGLAQAAMEDAVRYAGHREAFGEKISSFQQIGEMLTDMEVKLFNMRHFVYRVAQELNDGGSHRLEVSLMKRYVPAAATEVASDAMQILGGRGYTTAERVSSIWQDCRGFQMAEGTDQIMVHIATPLLMQKYGAR
ncbi:MAG: acyl-CoA dehydrogenase family protein [Raoultibacter sp.]